jgi:hypothetical protein
MERQIVKDGARAEVAAEMLDSDHGEGG